MLHYFGTRLDDYGHYFWHLDGESIYNRDLNFKDFPFDPESMPRRMKGELIRKGDVKFYHEGGYSICAIEGSCKDHRGGTKSVFFVKEDITNTELINRILSTPIAKRIIDAMPFQVRWTFDDDVAQERMRENGD
jgi:hypothetical protein